MIKAFFTRRNRSRGINSQFSTWEAKNNGASQRLVLRPVLCYLFLMICQMKNNKQMQVANDRRPCGPVGGKKITELVV
jgi:hypothetical protein